MNKLESHIHHTFSISFEDCKQVAALFKPELLEKGGHWLQAGITLGK